MGIICFALGIAAHQLTWDRIEVQNCDFSSRELGQNFSYLSFSAEIPPRTL